VLLLPEFCCVTLTSYIPFRHPVHCGFSRFVTIFYGHLARTQKYTPYSIIASTGSLSVPRHGHTKNNTTLIDVTGMHGARGGAVG
jgi:hypothetical protein